ncbi:MAG: secretion system protein [Rhodomicrobium sp.]|nr:secretion system protein [Rhodomicrobium sp.]
MTSALLYTVLPALILLAGTAAIATAFIVSPSRNQAMERRIGLVAGPMAAKPSDEPVEALKTSGDGPLDRRARQIFAAGIRYRWGMEASAVRLFLMAGIVGIGACLFMLRAVSLPLWIAAGVGVMAAFMVPRGLLKKQQRRAEGQFMDLFPDAIDTIVRMLRAGLPMVSAMRVVGDDGERPVKEVFGMIADQVGIGIPIEQALDAGSRHVGLEDFRFFAVAVLLQYSAGGNIAATLDMLSGIMRKRRAVRMKARSATAEIRLTGYVLSSLPFVVIGILLIIQPGYLDPLFADPRGHMILGAAAGLLVLSFVTMRQMMRSVTS